MSPKILIIGATGTIGSTVCELLQIEKADFCALVRNKEKGESLRAKGINTITGDLSDLDSLRRAMEGMDKVFLLSATSPDLPLLHGNAAKIAKEKGIKHMVKISARGASVDAGFNIGQFHGKPEKEIRDLEIPYTFLQPHSFFQNLFFERQSIIEQNAIYASMGEGKIPMIDTRDIAAVAVKALLNDGYERKSFVLTGPAAISYGDIADELTRVLGRRIKYIVQSAAESYTAMLSWGMPEWLVDDMTSLNKIYSANQATEVSPAVEQIIGKKPIGLRKFIIDFKKNFE